MLSALEISKEIYCPRGILYLNPDNGVQPDAGSSIIISIHGHGPVVPDIWVALSRAGSRTPWSAQLLALGLNVSDHLSVKEIQSRPPFQPLREVVMPRTLQVKFSSRVLKCSYRNDTLEDRVPL